MDNMIIKNGALPSIRKQRCLQETLLHPNVEDYFSSDGWWKCVQYRIWYTCPYTMLFFPWNLMCYKSLYSSKYLKLLTIWIKLLRLIYILILGLSASSKTVCKEGPFCGGGKNEHKQGKPNLRTLCSAVTIGAIGACCFVLLETVFGENNSIEYLYFFNTWNMIFFFLQCTCFLNVLCVIM